MHGGGRGLLLWSAQGGLGLGRRNFQFWGAHGGLRVTSVSAGMTEVRNQSSLGSCESIVMGVGIFVFAFSPGLASVPWHGGKKHKGGGGAMVVWVGTESTQRASG
jgi:hypothetical protein